MGFGDVYSNKELTIPLIKFLVYWSHGNINHKAREITYKVIQQISEAGFGQYLGVFPQVATNVALPLHIAALKVTTDAISTTTSLISGHSNYYQHLLSVGPARNALEGHANRITLSTVRFALSCMGDHLCVVAAAFPS